MLKALLKKQFLELNSFFFQNRKTGKRRGKAGVIGYAVLIAFVLIAVAGISLAVSSLLIDALAAAGMAWLYFSLTGIFAIALGAFGCVINTYAGLYHAKDNELLLSMPVPPAKILLVRMAGVFSTSLLYSALIWVPACVLYWFRFDPGAVCVIFTVLLTFLIAAFVTVLTCALGWIVALISGRLKNKSIVTAVIWLAFLAVYFYCAPQMSSFFQALLTHSKQVGAAVRVWFYPVYALGRAAAGEAVPMLIFTAITLALSALCVFVLARSFIRIVTTNRGSKKAVRKTHALRQTGASAALLRKELRRFLSSPTYMLNCGLGLILMPALSVYALIRASDLRGLLEAGMMMFPPLEGILPALAAAVVCLLISTGSTTSPSVSLEGKNIWIVQSLPVSAKQALRAKLRLFFLLSAPPAVVCSVLLGIILRIRGVDLLLMLALVLADLGFTAVFGLTLNLLKPNLTWTSEAVPVKQSAGVAIALFGGWLISVLIGAGAFLLRALPARLYLLLAIAVIASAAGLLLRWIDRRGAEIFETL